MLVGFMGAGKTSVGRALASALGVTFIDLDEAIETRAGTSIPEIFKRQGEAGFRDLESAVLAEELGGPGGVIATGGGIVESDANRKMLFDHTVVFLDVYLERALERAGDGRGRPMLSLEDPAALFARRRPLYEEVADLVVEGDADVDHVVSDIRRGLAP